MKLYLPLDSAAVALGADEIAQAIHLHAKSKGIALELVMSAINAGKHVVTANKALLAVTTCLPAAMASITSALAMP